MPNVRFGGTHCIDASEWDRIIEELSRGYLLLGTSIFEFWRDVAEIHVSAALSAANAFETPSARRGKLKVVQGGKRSIRMS